MTMLKLLYKLNAVKSYFHEKFKHRNGSVSNKSQKTDSDKVSVGKEAPLVKEEEKDKILALSMAQISTTEI